MWRVIAKRGEGSFLLTDEAGDPPLQARVLDVAMARLHPPHSTAAILEHEGWELVDDHPDLDGLLRGVEIMRAEEELPPRIVSIG